MLELLGLIFFGLIVYTFLVIFPSIVEHVATPGFKEAYFNYLSSKYINSYGK